MAQARSSSAVVRFGPFEADLANLELRKSGLRVRIQEQPFLVLATLLARREYRFIAPIDTRIKRQLSRCSARSDPYYGWVVNHHVAELFLP